MILALILAGGQGRRMGGADKGLLLWRGLPLVDAVLQGIAAQTGAVQAVALSANGHQADYARRGHPVLPDQRPGWPGPLAGVEAGLAHLSTLTVQSRLPAWLWTLPCDVPQFPAHTLSALMGQVSPEPDVPRWVRHQGRDHPACALWPLSSALAVRAALDSGQGSVLRLLEQLNGVAVEIPGDRPDDFTNCNTPQDL